MKTRKIVKVLITGSAGFLGSTTVDYLIDKDYSVIGVDDLSFGKISNINTKSKFYEEDIRNYQKIKNILLAEIPDYIVHMAADATTKSSEMGWKDPFKDYSVNMAGTLNLLEIIRTEKLNTHLIYASSAAVYGQTNKTPICENHPNNPLSPYGISKLTGEKYCYAYFKEWGIKTTIMRIFNTYGPRQPRYVIYDQIKNIVQNPQKVEILGTGLQIRDYSYVSDTIHAFYLAMIKPESIGQTFNIAGGEKISIKDLIQVIKTSLNLYPEEIYTGKSWKGDISILWANNQKILQELGWKPEVNLRDGIKRTINWMRENGEI